MELSKFHMHSDRVVALAHIVMNDTNNPTNRMAEESTRSRLTEEEKQLIILIFFTHVRIHKFLKRYRINQKAS